jgi:cytoskeleton-associated protein 5
VPAAAASSNLDVFKYKHTPEEAETISMELIPPQIMTDLGDPNWKTRLAALEEMTNWVEGQIETVDAEVIIRALAKKGWAEKNFQVSIRPHQAAKCLICSLQVSSKLYAILSLFAEKCPSFGRSCVALCVVHLTEKLGDAKLKKPAGDALIFFAEKTSLQFVFSQGTFFMPCPLEYVSFVVSLRSIIKAKGSQSIG